SAPGVEEEKVDLLHRTGTRRRSSSKKLNRKVIWVGGFCSSIASGGNRMAKFLPSGEMSRLEAVPDSGSRLSDHTRGLSARKESPFAVYVATMIRPSAARYKSSCAFGD